MKTTSDRQRNWFPRNRHGAAMLVIALCALAIVNFATAAIYTWDDGDTENSNWSTGTNWVGDSAPPSGAGHVVTFGDLDTDYGTNTMDAGWSGLGLTYENTTGLHTTDLSTNTLTLSGTGSYLRSGYDVNGSSATIQNGTLALGTSGARGTVSAGHSAGGSAASGSLVLSGGALNAYLATLYVAYTTRGFGPTVTGTLDLSGVSITTDGAANKLQVSDSIYVARGFDSSNAGLGNGTLKLPTSLTAITAATDLFFGGTRGAATVDLGGASSQLRTITARNFTFGTGNFGYNPGSGPYVLPSGVTMSIGSVGAPGTMRVGYSRSAGSATLALPGGTLTAFLTELSVGIVNSGNNPVVTGMLDLSTASAVTISNTGATRIGGGNNNGTGTIRLPSGSTVTTATLLIGTTAGTVGKLYLVDTNFAVTGATAGALTLGDGTGTAGTDLIDIQILGTSSGLDIQGTASTVLSVGTSGLINITFMQDPLDVTLGTALDHTDIFYGLMWAGDHVADLTALGTKLAWDDTTNLTGDFNNAAGVFYDSGTGATYVGFYINQVVIPEPASLALLGLGAAWLLNRRRRESGQSFQLWVCASRAGCSGHLPQRRD